MNEHEVGWTAGIVDGEGYLGLESYNNKTTFCVRVGNTDTRMLCRLKELWGGKIYFNNRPDRPNNKPFWFWIIKGKINAYPCIKAIEPFLIVKREKAQVILQFAIDRWGDKLKT